MIVRVWMLAKGFVSLCFGDYIWAGSAARSEGGGEAGMETSASRGCTTRLWLGGTGFWLLCYRAAGGKGEVGRAYMDSSERGRGQGYAGQ